jgi:hypothetical protein
MPDLLANSVTQRGHWNIIFEEAVARMIVCCSRESILVDSDCVSLAFRTAHNGDSAAT